MPENETNESQPEPVWVDFEYTHGTPYLYGNRAGLTFLKEAIDRALASESEYATIEQKGVVFSSVQLHEVPQPIKKREKSRKDEAKDAGCLLGCALLVFVVLMTMAFGVIFIWKLWNGTAH